jgi:hypothetical protein
MSMSMSMSMSMGMGMGMGMVHDSNKGRSVPRACSRRALARIHVIRYFRCACACYLSS